jgi:hypothetical protein
VGPIDPIGHQSFSGPLIPKGMGLPYVGFSDSGQADVNAFYF